MSYRNLTNSEIQRLEAQYCRAEDWSKVQVAEAFETSHVYDTRFSGDIRLGVFENGFKLPGGVNKHSGLNHATLHNVTVGNNCLVENVKNYIANYNIGDDAFIENVDVIFTDGDATFGNGVEVCVLNETGGREVMIYDRMSAQQAYVMALYRYRTAAVEKLREMIVDYTKSVTSTVGTIGAHSRIVDSGYIKNVKVGEYCKIQGSARLKNGSINSNEAAPVRIGVGVIGDDFIICSGSTVKEGVMFTRCFIGQNCHLGHGYSASDSLFFANCQGENGEACAVFAGPYTVTHHKSSLLIAGMFSFMNAGSGSNQSNHMYKLGPIHQGIMERGAKTSSDSYILWPAKVGPFSLVMGRHTNHQDTSNLPFSYLIEQQSTTFIMPGANLKSVGTIRDARKWPRRDGREDPDKIDLINYNLLSPFTASRMLNGIGILKNLQQLSGENSEVYSYQSGSIRKSSLKKGLKFYGMALDKFLGNSLISRIQASKFSDIESLRRALVPSSRIGEGSWDDMSGMIAPRSEIRKLLADIEKGTVKDILEVGKRFAQMHDNYYTYEWTWAYDAIKSYYGMDLSRASAEDLKGLVSRWQDSVITLDNMLLEDARKEFSLSAMTSFGADGDRQEAEEDFEQVRGASFEKDAFVKSIREHIEVKSALGREMLELLNKLK